MQYPHDYRLKIFYCSTTTASTGKRDILVENILAYNIVYAFLIRPVVRKSDY
jgi:hypothetical protein